MVFAQAMFFVCPGVPKKHPSPVLKIIRQRPTPTMPCNVMQWIVTKHTCVLVCKFFWGGGGFDTELKYLIDSFQSFELDNGVTPNDNLTHVTAFGSFGVFQDDVQKGIVSPECPDKFAVSVQQ